MTLWCEYTCDGRRIAGVKRENVPDIETCIVLGDRGRFRVKDVCEYYKSSAGGELERIEVELEPVGS